MYQLYCLGLFFGGSQKLPKQCYLACVIVLVCFYKTGISFFHYLQYITVQGELTCPWFKGLVQPRYQGLLRLFTFFICRKKKAAKALGTRLELVISNLKAPFSLIGWAIFLFHFWILLTFLLKIIIEPTNCLYWKPPRSQGFSAVR